jgi:hypothetical protein
MRRKHPSLTPEQPNAVVSDQLETEETDKLAEVALLGAVIDVEEVVDPPLPDNVIDMREWLWDHAHKRGTRNTER